MRVKVVVASFICAFALGLLPEAKAQVVTATPDSVVIPTENVSPEVRKKLIGDWSKPAKAAFYSAILPGLGQAYNKSYWKIPLVYATGAVIGYFIYDNNRQYQNFDNALTLRTDGNPATVDAYVSDPNYGIGLYGDQGTNNLRRGRDFFRKYRDLDIILAFLAYGLNIMEAHVDAHLQAFDVNDDLALQIKPNLVPITATNQITPALTLHLNLKR